MDQPPTPDSTAWPFPFARQDWEQTPPVVQTSLHTVQHDLVPLHDLRERVAALEARLQQDAPTSHRPPSSDSPYKKLRPRPTATPPQKAGGPPGHPGHRQAFVPPTVVHE